MAVDIDLAVEKAADGKWIRERVPARVPDEESFELANSPMLVRGLAADDRIRLSTDGQFELLSWGRNVAVQVFGEWGEVDALTQHIESIGGRLDGKEPRIRVFTIPIDVGVRKIESTIDNVVKDWPKLSWMFGNLTEIDLFIGRNESGAPLHEQVFAFENPDDSFELVTSPLLVTGVAAGDVLTLQADGAFDVTAPSGNVAVQVFGDWNLGFFAPKAEKLGGRLDADASGHVAAFTFGSEVGRAEIEMLFDGTLTDGGDGNDRSWRFGNPESAA